MRKEEEYGSECQRTIQCYDAIIIEVSITPDLRRSEEHALQECEYAERKSIFLFEKDKSE